MIQRKLAECKKWEPAEYAAGYGARFSEISKVETSRYWRQVGWEDAPSLAARVEEKTPSLNEAVFAAFLKHSKDSARTHPWKEGWISADISLGVLGEEAS